MIRSARGLSLALLVAAGAARADDAPLMSLPYTPGLDVAAMDASASPCVDFYQYACGGWMKRNPIPSDQPRWSVYGKLFEENQRYLWGVLVGLDRVRSARTQVQAQLADYFTACMDEAEVERRGKTPVDGLLARIDGLRGLGELPAVLAELHVSLGDATFFEFSSAPDFADSARVIAFASAGGLSLPDRDQYLKTDPKSVELRGKLVAHMRRMLELLGDAPKVAADEAAAVLRIETALAAASLSRVDRRDPHKLFHKVDARGLGALTPRFDWAAYLKALGIAAPAVYNVTEPAFYQGLERELETRPLAELKAYLRWHVVKAAAPRLARRFVDESFDFFSRTLRGVPSQQPRWKRCVGLVDRQLGEALGQEFVRRAFSPELKARTLHMTQQIEAAMEQDLTTLGWMGPETKRRALEKLHAIVNKIGYPDRWRDYSSIAIKADDFFGNALRATGFEERRELAKIGKPLDRGEWQMTPPTVNAGYDPQLNDIAFPAGVLQPPLYDPRMDDAPGYGNTGGTIGHELTHGFDDEGRQFDGAGNLKNWWTDADGKTFDQRAQCIVDQYAQYVVVDDIKINSKLTEGEDVADLGGLILAWMAWKAQTAAQKPAPRDGLTPEQRFFVGYAQWACENNRPENLRVSALTDPHSPGKYRVNGLVVNMPEFERAFACRAGQPMVRKDRCRVW